MRKPGRWWMGLGKFENIGKIPLSGVISLLCSRRNKGKNQNHRYFESPYLHLHRDFQANMQYFNKPLYEEM